MNPFEMVVLIVIVAVAGGIVKHMIDRRAEASVNEKDFNSALDGLLQRLDRMEHRIAVIEEIVSSDGYHLKQRFRDIES